MKNFLRSIEAHKWELIGCTLMGIAGECFKIAGIKMKEQVDIQAEAEAITRKTSGD